MAEPDRAATSVKSAVATPPKAPPEIQIKVSWCKGCGLCVEYCNRGVLEMKDGLAEVVNAEKCSRCMLCEAICPDFAITVIDRKEDAAAGDGGGR